MNQKSFPVLILLLLALLLTSCGASKGVLETDRYTLPLPEGVEASLSGGGPSADILYDGEPAGGITVYDFSLSPADPPDWSDDAFRQVRDQLLSQISEDRELSEGFNYLFSSSIYGSFELTLNGADFEEEAHYFFPQDGQLLDLWLRPSALPQDTADLLLGGFAPKETP